MKFKNPLFLMFLSWIVSALTIVGIAFVATPNTYIDGFWYRVVWTEFLNILFWFGNYGWFIENKTNSGMAITPATNLLTSVYCVLSFVLICCFYKTESIYGLNTAHTIIQILLFGIYLLLMLRLLLAAHFADKGLTISKEASLSPINLGQQIKKIEKNSPKDIAIELKKLREKITYSLQDNNHIRTNDKYKQLVHNLTTKIEKRQISIAEIKIFITVVDDLIYTTKRD